VRTKRQERIRAALFLIAAVGAIAVALIAYGFGFLNNLERQSVDLRFSIRGNQGAPKDIVIVMIDSTAFDDLKIRWPFRRDLQAKVLDRIYSGDPAAIAFDVQFTEPAERPEEDNALINAVARTKGKTVLATTEVGQNGETSVFGGGEVLRGIGAHVGNSNFPTDRDGVIRRSAYEIDKLRTFPIVAAEIARGKPIADGGSNEWIDYAGPPGTVESVSFSRVLPFTVVRRGQGPRPWQVVSATGHVVRQAPTEAAARRIARALRVSPRIFKDKVVVIGATAPSLQDLHDTSTGPLMPGPEIQANAIETALRGFPLQAAPTWVNVLLIVLLGLIAPLASMRTKPLIAIGAAIVVAAAFVVLTQVVFNHGWIVAFVYPMMALTLSTVGVLGAHLTVVAFERERVRDLFSRFVPEQVVDQVLAQTDADLRLGGKETTATVLFSDLRGFTTFSETRPAEEVITILNQYLGEMSEAILGHSGTLVSYMGDGIMAVFGAPIEQEDHADRALAASREMLLERLPRFNAWMREQGLGQEFVMGVGLNSGPIAVGNVGHERRLEYTAIGDVTNTASRIEGMTKGTPFSLFLSESTLELLLNPPEDLVFVDEMEVRGRQAKLRLWALDMRRSDEPRKSTVEAEAAAAN
jgi:adenylate cyclase